MINWSAFTPASAITGGAFIGMAAAILILGSGRILGMSGIIKSAITTLPRFGWQWSFILGMVLATWGYKLLFGLPSYAIEHSSILIIIAGMLMGIGTQMGSGCTSGHGVCGVSRFSKRSLVATLCFMLSGIATACMMVLA